MRGQSFNVVIGRDRPVPTRTIVHQKPRPLPTGLDWSTITSTTPEPPRPPQERAPRRRRDEGPSRAQDGPHEGRAGYVDRILDRLNTLGLTSGQLRDWADVHHVDYNPRGLIRESVIDAYENRHATGKGRP